MKFPYYYDGNEEKIYSYKELKELHADLVKYQETEILDFNEYLKECTNNGDLFGAEKFQISDIFKIVTSEKARINCLKHKEVELFLTTWGSVHTNKGFYVTSNDDIEEYAEELTSFFEKLGD